MVAGEKSEEKAIVVTTEKEKLPEDKKAKEELDLSDEDKKLQEDLNLAVQRLQEDDESVYRLALDNLRSQIRAATTSMTSVPKPLKFLRPHYDSIKAVHEKIRNAELKKLCADVISVLGMTMGTGRDCLKYRILGSQEQVGIWGHEYVRHLAAELGEEWREQETRDKNAALDGLIRDIVAHHMSHNAEAEAVDLLMELERLELLMDFVDEHSQPRVCLYLISCVPYVPDPENIDLLRTALKIYQKFKKGMEALRTAIMLNERDLMLKIIVDTPDIEEKKQMAILLGRQQVFLDLPDDLLLHGDLTELISNTTLSHNFLSLARELDITEPKHPDDIYKTHLEPTRGSALSSQQPDSARKNLANAIVSGLVNCGFGSDKLLAEDQNWFFKHKELGMFTAAASHGLLHRWEIENGLVQIDKFLYSNEDNIKAGSLLAVGIISSGVQHECDPAAALLLDYVVHEKNVHRIGSILGLGIAYANSSRSSVQDQVIPGLLNVLDDGKSNAEVLGLTALALGFICVGTGKLNAHIAMRLWEVLTENEKDLNTDANYRWIALGIGLIYLGRQEDGADTMLESLKALPSPYNLFASTLFDACAYAGTGNVLKVQQLLHICSTHLTIPKEEKEKGASASGGGGGSAAGSGGASAGASGSTKKSAAGSGAAGSSASGNNNAQTDQPDGWLEQAIAVIGIGLIASAEDVGNAMSSRMFGNLLRYGDVWVRRAVPLAMALTAASNPTLSVLETLSKFSHDADPETAYNAIFAMGIVGAGTNNARLGAMLRQLAAFHQRDASSLFLVRLAQGLAHMGKGTLTLHPYHYDRQLLCLPSLAALLATTFAFLDVKNTILGKQHYLIYCIIPAMQPRMLTTFELEESTAELKPVSVAVRVGQAVDVVGQAGKPKTITGFQTHTTPVLLAYGERAELATEEYLSIAPIMEGFVILKKNKDYEQRPEKS